MHYSNFLSCLLLLGFCSSAGFSAGKKRNTHPQPPANKVNHLDRLDMAAEVPHPIEKYRYVVKGDSAGIVYYPNVVPLWSYSEGRYQSGELALGTEVIPDFIRASSGRNFYGWDREDNSSGSTIKRTVWIDGRFLKVDGVK